MPQVSRMIVMFWACFSRPAVLVLAGGCGAHEAQKTMLRARNPRSVFIMADCATKRALGARALKRAIDAQRGRPAMSVRTLYSVLPAVTYSVFMSGPPKALLVM